MADMLASVTMPNTGGWKDRHNAAVHRSAYAQPPVKFETAIGLMVRGWQQYAKDHKAEYESPIGDDGVLGPEWLAIGKALLGLLNGQCGRFDCGTLDAFIRDTVHENGFPDELQ
jgi:hypothetical protein